MAFSFQLTIDCHDPASLLQFWAAALDYRVPEAPGAHLTWRDYYLSIGVPADELGEGDAADRLEDPSEQGPSIWFQQVPESKTVKNRVHLDIQVSPGRGVPRAQRLEAVVGRAHQLEQLGGRVLNIHDDPESDHAAVTMADPEGNEFCLV